MIQQYLFKRKPYIFLAIASFIFLVLGAYFSQRSTWDYIYKIAISIYATYTIIIVTKVVLRHLLYYIFAKEDKMWVKEIDRPRVAITMLSIFFMYLSFDTHTSNLENNIHQIVSVIIYLLSFVLLVVGWSEKFKERILPQIRESIGEPTTVIAATSKLEETSLQLLRSRLEEKYITGNAETIYKLLSYETLIEKIDIIKEEDKLEWICQSGLNNNQKYNSQTLLSFISNLYDTEDSIILTNLIKKLFKEEYHISHKNISTWKSNKSKYLKAFEDEFVKLISDRNTI